MNLQMSVLLLPFLAAKAALYLGFYSLTHWLTGAKLGQKQCSTNLTTTDDYYYNKLIIIIIIITIIKIIIIIIIKIIKIIKFFKKSNFSKKSFFSIKIVIKKKSQSSSSFFNFTKWNDVSSFSQLRTDICSCYSTAHT